ncbi:hypothetical protein C2G38_734678 [Gigaspora rosea]|uniref:Uncharacterized protein n=1 Tax=Gigaspora rosea TaxID=44941 RepID=A0A397U9V1_9GLOM|nr:hypothetical protein C2G38_734678 [Gigaspora rosea]
MVLLYCTKFTSMLIILRFALNNYFSIPMYTFRKIWFYSLLFLVSSFLTLILILHNCYVCTYVRIYNHFTNIA